MAKRQTPAATTIAIKEPEGTIRKITKIVPYKEGGFAVLVPYHTARKGYLAKHRVDYRENDLHIRRTEITEYSADDRVKLSFHKDGFVQFSGEKAGKIVSGRDPESGEPKGLGILLEHPLFNPITSGPTFNIIAWGLSEFEAIQGTSPVNTLVFSEEDFYYRRCTPDSCNAYLIEAFLFSQYYWSGTQYRQGRLRLSLV